LPDLIVSIRRAISINAPPRNQSDDPILPVLSVRIPTSIGPANPPRLPTEFISAIPPAAAVPPRNVVARAQKGPTVDFNPTKATVRAIIAR